MGKLFDSVVTAAKENFWHASDEPRTTDPDSGNRPINPESYSHFHAAIDVLKQLDDDTLISVATEQMGRDPFVTEEGESLDIDDVRDELVSRIVQVLEQDVVIMERVGMRDALASALPRTISTP